MALTGGENYRKALSMASNLGSPEDAKKIQEKMFELEGYGIKDEKDQKRALEMEKIFITTFAFYVRFCSIICIFITTKIKGEL